MQTDCPSLADQGGLTKAGGFSGWPAGEWALGTRTGRGFCEKAEAVSRIGRVRARRRRRRVVLLVAAAACACACAAWVWGIALRQSESIVAKSGHANGRPSRGLGSQESIRKRRAGLAGETGRAAEPGSQVPWGC